MKRIKFLASALGVALVLLSTSCKKDDDPVKTVITTPVLGTNFDFTVTGNSVAFTTTLTGNVSIKNETSNVETPFVDGACSVFLAAKGDYPFTCQTLIDGEIAKSEVFTVTIGQDDLKYLDREPWKSLSGGANKTKTWRLSLDASGKSLYFDGPVYYSGADGDPYWAWDVLELPYTNADGKKIETFFNWSPDYMGNKGLMAAMDYGTITFSGADLVASTDKFGVKASGSFSFDTATMKMTLTGVTLPTDTARINDGQFENLGDLRIFSLSDSAMQIGIKRSFEDGKDSKWTMIYNFICTAYEYPIPEEFTFSEPVKTSFAKADLVGTWKYDIVPMGWITWTATGDQGSSSPARLYGNWSTSADVVAGINWASNVDSTITANKDKEYIFNSDGTCTLDGVANTFTVANGVITFGTALDGTELNGASGISLTGTEVKVIDFDKKGDDLVDAGFTGTWLGQQNDGKNEYKAIQLKKQP